MAQIVDTPIEFRCPVCGKIQKILGGEGRLGPLPLDLLRRKHGNEYCRCGMTQAKK